MSRGRKLYDDDDLYDYDDEDDYNEDNYSSVKKPVPRHQETVVKKQQKGTKPLPPPSSNFKAGAKQTPNTSNHNSSTQAKFVEAKTASSSSSQMKNVTNSFQALVVTNQTVASEKKGAPLTDHDLAPQLSNITIVITGHVDAGKSTLLGNLLYQLGNISQKIVHKYRKESQEAGKGSFALAWIMDESQSERQHGVTIDLAERYLWSL
jgi:elongation factor 1 alpha-like protein